MADDNFVVDHAREKGWPIVLATPFELINVAQGRPMILGTTERASVCLKIPTVEEYFAALEADRPKMEAQGIVLPPLPSRAQIETLVSPMYFPSGL